MRVLLFSPAEFPHDPASGAPSTSESLHWLGEFSAALKSRDISVDYFRLGQTKLETSDILHTFGFTRPENWYWMGRLVRAQILSPYPGETWQEAWALAQRDRWWKRGQNRELALDRVTYWLGEGATPLEFIPMQKIVAAPANIALFAEQSALLYRSIK